MAVRPPTDEERAALEQAQAASPAGGTSFTYTPGEPPADGEPPAFTYKPGER